MVYRQIIVIKCFFLEKHLQRKKKLITEQSAFDYLSLISLSFKINVL